MKLNAIIVEDEANSREILTNYLSKYCASVNLLGEAASIKEGLELINKHQPDLIFLDVEMPFGNAFDLLDQVPNRTFETVFVTAYNQYAMDALNSHAAYYLMKPINIDELIKAVEYVGEIRSKENALEDQILQPKTNKIDGKITLPQQDGFQVLNVADILFCKADDNYTEIYLDNKKILVSKTLKYFEEAMEDFPFARIHKSYLVNVNAIAKYKKGKGGSVVLHNGKELLVSASKKKALLSYFE
ncbi:MULTISPECIES: LytR/AlgR family response regulator transcription factor [Cellulophaga]|uniref:Two component transcriptional regulator, LytTR family n=2 Tax=Cellulophaga TaxID=104264 RepID=F0RCM8_CELLC|nr:MULTISPECIES: LytTR family DNA-binding domain-containing protein [Cellulophaga]ADY29725.1 two component transcriptional regulator, LytTR family [Cellulophaga lytica DSM 7489]AIM60726.1 LytR family transcriptional regulator [Cellulophaga lytica]EWH15230.1 LytTR family two component transcriptional regulator [Cellulophaga geojensis KL-A]MDO6852526.1 LytTR family DNA-binding domain-containing protein [Cellulophaga lytica]TVZ07726.1 LytTR family two component transcriptional regulator [Cellulop